MPSRIPDDLSATSSLSSRRFLLLILAVGGFTSALNVTMLSPLLVDIAHTFDISEAAAGQLVTLTAASSGLMAITVAPWMDRYPRAVWLRLECSLLAIGTVISALAPSFGWMFVGRAFAGVGGAVIGASCLAACSDLFADKQDRNRALGMINSAFTLGAVFGLPLVTLAADWTSWRIAIALLTPLPILVFLGATLIPATPSTVRGSMAQAWRDGYARVIASRETLWLLAAEIVFMMAWFGWLIYFGALTETVYGISAAVLSFMFLAGGGAEMAANNLTPLMLRHRAPRKVASAAAVVSAINLGLVGIAYDRDWTLFPFIVIASASAATIFIALNIALLDSLPGDPGAAMSLQSACFEGGGALGVALTGAALALLDDYDAVYRGLGVLMPVVILLLWISAKYRSEPETTSADPVAVPA